jgi:hypothetical protein
MCRQKRRGVRGLKQMEMTHLGGVMMQQGASPARDLQAVAVKSSGLWER